MFLCVEIPIFSLKNTIFLFWVSFQFWSVLIRFRFFVFVKVVQFSYKHLHFFVKVLRFLYKHLRFFAKVVQIFAKVLLRMFTNFLLILLVCVCFGFLGFLWA